MTILEPDLKEAEKIISAAVKMETDGQRKQALRAALRYLKLVTSAEGAKGQLVQ